MAVDSHWKALTYDGGGGGGGDRIPLVRESVKTGVAVLAGDAFVNGTDSKRLIMLESEFSGEINVIGAALCGSEG